MQALFRCVLTGWLFVSPWLIVGQPSDFQVFLQASLREDYDEALRYLSRQPDSVLQLETWLAREEAFRLELIQKSRVPLSPPAQAGLLRAQALLAYLRPEQTIEWHAQSAETVLFYQSSLADSILPVLTRSLKGRVYELRPIVWQELARAMLERIPNDQKSWNEWLDTYQVLDYVLIQMPVISPELLGQADQRRKELRAFLNVYGEDCEAVYAREDSRVRLGFATPAEYARLFILMETKACGWTASEDTIRRRAAQLGISPYILLRAAESYLEQEVFWETQRLLMLAVDAEKDPRMKAAMELRMAGLYAIRRSFRSARLHARQADELYPAWGQPLIFLADLIESSGAMCADSRLERLALTYLAIDYTSEAAQRNPALYPEASARLRFLENRIPPPEELAFLGLRIGDRIPITCWINEVARVR